MNYKNISILHIFLLCIGLINGYHALAQPLSGVYTVGGAGAQYTSLGAIAADLNTYGVSGPVVINISDGTYTTNVWRASFGNISGTSSTNRIVIKSASNDATKVTIDVDGTSSDNYVIHFDDANYITLAHLTLINNHSSYGTVVHFEGTASYDTIRNCVLKGYTTTSSSTDHSVLYAYGFTGQHNVIINNKIQEGGTSIYWRGSGTTTCATATTFHGNLITNTKGYYGIYAYYNSGLSFNNNNLQRSSTDQYRSAYMYYSDSDFSFSNNTFRVTAGSTLYGLQLYYINYTSQNPAATVVFENNDLEFNNTSTTYARLAYAYYLHNRNNIVTIKSTSGSTYSQLLNYYCYYSQAKNNTLNVEHSSGGYLYNYINYNGNASDSVLNNQISLKGTSTSIDNYLAAYLYGVTKNNIINISNTSGTVDNHVGYYNYGGLFIGNETNITTTTGTIYGLKNYNYNGSATGGGIVGNRFDLKSTSGTIYGLYAYQAANDKYISNLITTKTSGSSYLYSAGSGIYRDLYMFNNTFHSNSTGSTNYLIYIPNSRSSTYSGNSIFMNNVFSRTVGTGNAVQIKDNSNIIADYNNYYTFIGSTKFAATSQSLSTTSLQTWRIAVEQDSNSLTYDPGYMDISANDYRPDPANANSWSVHGRGMHLQGDTLDILGNARPRTRENGVPDLGAYEFVPTSLPPNAIAQPAMPSPNTNQVFTFGQDTVAVIAWGTNVPSQVNVKQYSGVAVTALPAGTERMYFYTAIDPVSGSGYDYEHTPFIYYKNPWLGDISTEGNAKIAKSSDGGIWQGYNFGNGITDTMRNILTHISTLDSIGTYSGVENARIGIRCVTLPTGLEVDSITANSAHLTWDEIFNPLGYQIVVDNNPAAPVSSAGAMFVTTITPFVPLSGLTEDTKYYVHVRNICGAKDTSDWETISFTTLITCHIPVVQFADIKASSAVGYWDTVKTAFSYEYAITKSPVPTGVGTTIYKNSMLFAGLEPGTEYFVHIRAKCNSMYAVSDWGTYPIRTSWPTDISGTTKEHARKIDIHPNPTTDYININLKGMFDSKKESHIEILDIAGKAILVVPVTSDAMKINVSELESGLYLVKFSGDYLMGTNKFIKQ